MKPEIWSLVHVAEDHSPGVDCFALHEGGELLDRLAELSMDLYGCTCRICGGASRCEETSEGDILDRSRMAGLQYPGLNSRFIPAVKSRSKRLAASDSESLQVASFDP